MQFAGTLSFQPASPGLAVSQPRSISPHPYRTPISHPAGVGLSNNLSYAGQMPRGSPVMPAGLPYPSVGPYSIPFAMPQVQSRMPSPYAGLPMQYPGISLGPPPALPGMYRGLPFGSPLTIGSKDHLVPSYVGYKKLDPS